MSANQITGTSANAASAPANPSASAILQNFFGGKQQTSGEKTSETTAPSPDESIAAGDDVISRALTRLDEKKERAAVNLGITAGEVETMPFDLSQLETEGIFLNIDASGFGALARQLEWKTLGIELPAATSVSLSPPRAGLLPDSYRKKLLRGAAQAHHALNKYRFRFTLCETVWERANTSGFRGTPSSRLKRNTARLAKRSHAPSGKFWKTTTKF